MPAVNTQKATRHSRTVDLIIDDGAAEHTISRIVNGSLVETPGGTQADAEMDGDLYTGNVSTGTERESVITLQTLGSPGGRAAMEALLQPADVGDMKTTFVVHIDRYDDGTKTTGKRHTYENCYLPTPPVHNGAGDTGHDTINFTIHSTDSYPTVTSLT